MTEPIPAGPAAGGLRGNMQKAAVRVIASELDRRSGALERALTDLTARVESMSVEARDHRAATEATLARALEHVNEVARQQDRLSARLEELTGRVRAREAIDEELLVITGDLRGDVTAAQSALAEVTAVLDRRAAPRG